MSHFQKQEIAYMLLLIITDVFAEIELYNALTYNKHDRLLLLEKVVIFPKMSTFIWLFFMTLLFKTPSLLSTYPHNPDE